LYISTKSPRTLLLLVEYGGKMQTRLGQDAFRSSPSLEIQVGGKRRSQTEQWVVDDLLQREDMSWDPEKAICRLYGEQRGRRNCHLLAGKLEDLKIQPAGSSEHVRKARRVENLRRSHSMNFGAMARWHDFEKAQHEKEEDRSSDDELELIRSQSVVRSESYSATHAETKVEVSPKPSENTIDPPKKEEKAEAPSFTPSCKLLNLGSPSAKREDLPTFSNWTKFLTPIASKLKVHRPTAVALFQELPPSSKGNNVAKKNNP
jgi:hypothetical protein